MATLTVPTPHPAISELLPLEAGDHLDRHAFHQRYEAMPPEIRAELIGGTVYMPSPLKAAHGSLHVIINVWIGLYWGTTPGLRVMDNATIKLGADSEPQPDLALLIVGGQSKIDESDYVVGPPEFIAEVASSSISYDLHSKKADYERHGVREYLVLSVFDHRAFWFVREGGAFVEMPADAEGIHRSRFLPGLWLDAAAVFRGDTKRIQEVLNLGLQTPEHAAFVASRLKA